MHRNNWATVTKLNLTSETVSNEKGCRDFYGPIKGRECDEMELDRLDMSLRQPQSMVVRPRNCGCLFMVQNGTQLSPRLPCCFANVELHIERIHENSCP